MKKGMTMIKQVQVLGFSGLKYSVNDRLLEDGIVTVFFVLFPTNNPSTYFFSLG